MDAKGVKETVEDLMSMFNQRMAHFENQLVKSPEKSPTVEALAADYYNFKSFILKAIKTIFTRIETVESAVDQQEMRCRRKILLLHGLPESSDEKVSSVVVRAMVEQFKYAAFTETDISRCHRMGRVSNPDKPRPVLCKFKDVGVRDKVWSSKSCLKGSGISVSEFLTKPRHDIFMAARQRFGIAKCWTRDGSVFVLGGDGSRHRISSLRDLDSIQQEAPKASTSRTTRAAAATVVAAAPTKRANSKARTATVSKK